MTRTSVARTRNKAGSGTEAGDMSNPPKKHLFYMAIINGQYVPETLPSYKEAQNQVFGEYHKGDLGDISTLAYNYLMKQQEQAHNLELWNLQNQYNSPSAQMARYQDAGLNPNLIYSKDNMASAPASYTAPSYRPNNTMTKAIQTGLDSINSIVNLVKSARDTYDYIKYGSETSAWQRNLTMQRSQSEALQNYWNSYMLGLPSLDSIPGSPRQQLQQYQMDTQRANYDRIRALVSLIPEQAARQRALTQLDQNREAIMKGQYDFILHGFDTGNDTLNSFLRMFMMFGMSSLF